MEAANRFLREDYIAEFNRRFQVPPRLRAMLLCPAQTRDLERIFSLQFDRSETRQHGELSESELADRAGALAGDVGGLPGGSA